MSSNKPLARIESGGGLAQAIVDTVREPLLVLDEAMRVVAASRSFYLAFQTSPQEVEGRSIFSLADGSWDVGELRALLAAILSRHVAMEGYEVEQEFAGSGHRTMLLNARAVFDDVHAEGMILLAMEDVTQRRAAERASSSLMRQKDILLQEMQHRVANSLQIIASVLLLKAQTVQSEEARRHLHEAHQRVMSVAAVQQHLHASGHRELIEIGPYLTHLCENSRQLDDRRGSSGRVVGSGPARNRVVERRHEHRSDRHRTRDQFPQACLPARGRGSARRCHL